MLDKIVWLLILDAALGAPLETDPSGSKSEDQRPRSSRSIWPFTSGSTEPPIPIDENFFVSEDTALPEGIDLNRYPLWKIHKYQGIDLKPVQVQQVQQVQQVAPYPPETVAVDASRFDASSDGRQTSYQTGYNNFLESKIVTHQGTQGGPYLPESENSAKEAAPYPPQVEAAYPPESPSFQSGEFQSSDYWNSEHSRQKFTAYAPPVAPHSTYGAPVAPHSTYGVPETYQAPTFAHQESSGFQQEQPDSASKPDLSFLDNLGGLAPFLPEPEDQTEAPSGGFLQSLISRIRGTTEAPAIAEEAVPDEPVQSGGFLSSIFGSSQSTGQTSSSGGSLLSSLFYSKEEPASLPAPAPAPAITYYLPETKGSYVAVKLPPGAQSGFVPNFGPHVATIPFHEAPKVSFVPDAIPQVSAATTFHGTQERNAASADQIDHTDVTGAFDQKNSVAYQPPNPQDPTVHSAASQSHEAPAGSSAVSQISSYSPSAAYQIHISNSNEERNANHQQRQNSQTVHVSSQAFLAGQPTKTVSETSVRLAEEKSEQHQSQSSFETSHQAQRQPVAYQQQTSRDAESYQKPAPVYQVSPSAYVAPIDPPGPTEHYDNLPVHAAVDFRETSSQQDNRNQVAKQQLSSLTSYGTPTLSYHVEPFLASPSDRSEVIVETEPVRLTEEPLVNQELPKESETAKEKFIAEETKLKGQIRRRSSPERQAPTEAKGSSVYRTQVDLVPDVREGRHYDGTMITDGYSRVKQIIPTSTS